MAENRVYYHLPDDEQFSLDYVADSRDTLDDRLDSYDEPVETAVETYELDEVVHAIYTKTDVVETADALQNDLDAAFADMEPSTRVIVRELLEVFEGVQEKKYDEEGVPLDVYKNVGIDRLPEALDRVDWAKPVPRSGGQLVSNLVLCHALPNANHRTAFAMLESYVKATRPSFECPSLVTDDYEWERWVDGYIVDSKRLLTVRRNVGPFSYLSQYGCETVARKGGIKIRLREYDLDVSPYEALSQYAREHERRSRDFVETLLERTANDGLIVEPGIEKSEFADYVRRLD